MYDQHAFQPFDRTKSLSLTAGLLVNPDFQANTLRIEVLIKHLISDCMGNDTPTITCMEWWLNSFHAVAEMMKMEDPIEDVFVSKVLVRWGEIRVYGGVWEGFAFYLQQVLSLVERIPEKMVNQELIRPMRALLLLSEEIAKRNNAVVNVIGDGNEAEKIKLPSFDEMVSRGNTLIFSADDLTFLDCRVEDLSSFILDESQYELTKDMDATNPLSARCPLIRVNGMILVFLPTAISWAIRIHAFDWLRKNNLLNSFEQNLVGHYIDLLRSLPIMSKYIPKGKPRSLTKTDGCFYIDFVAQVQVRRIVHLILRIDTLDGFMDGTNIGNSDAHSKEIQRRIEYVKGRALESPGYVEGVSIVILAGYGRGNNIELEFSEDWPAACITVQDLETITWNPGTNSSTIYRFIKHELDLLKRGVAILNPNGILNLFGWWKRNNESFVPLDVDLNNQEPSLVVIPFDCIAEVRKIAADAIDRHIVKYIDGSLKVICRKHISNHFGSAKGSSLYVSFTDVKFDKMLGCSVSTKCTWWVSLVPGTAGVDRDLSFRIWDAAHNWLELIGRTLEEQFPNNRVKEVLFDIDISQLVRYDEWQKIDPSDNLYEVKVSSPSVIQIVLRQSFLNNLQNPRNVSERALVRAFLEGFFMLVNLDSTAIEEILSMIAENDSQRYIHFFQAKTFRQVMQRTKAFESEVIDRSDFSLLRIGLGHFKTPGEKNIIGQKQCLQFLGDLVDHIYGLLKSDLCRFMRVPLVFRLMNNIEAITSEKDTWRRTTRAMLSIHKNDQSVVSGKTKHFGTLTIAEITSRILIEIANCESPEQEGLEITDLDLSPLLAKASMLFQFGNISDGIKKGIIAADIHVAPNGDVRTDTSFQDDVLFNVVSYHEEEETRLDAKAYEKHFPSEVEFHDKSYFPVAFLEAFREETGVTIDDIKHFLELIEDIGHDKNLGVFLVQQGYIVSHANHKSLTDELCISRILNAFCLKPRDRWEIPPENFIARDIQPWSFRRRLSMYFRPILQVDTSVDPDLVLSPGFCRDAFAYVLDTYHRAFVDPEWCRSDRMKEWIGKEALRRGTEFTREVGTVLERWGFNVLYETQVSSIVPQRLLTTLGADKNFGDFDLIAWKKGGPEVYLIECKSLMFAKTFGEIGEQLQEFKGEERSGKPDRLKRHLDRIDLVQNNLQLLKQYLRLSHSPSIVPYVIFSKAVPMLFVKGLPSDVFFSHLSIVQKEGLTSTCT